MFTRSSRSFCSTQITAGRCSCGVAFLAGFQIRWLLAQTRSWLSGRCPKGSSSRSCLDVTSRPCSTCGRPRTARFSSGSHLPARWLRPHMNCPLASLCAYRPESGPFPLGLVMANHTPAGSNARVVNICGFTFSGACVAVKSQFCVTVFDLSFFSSCPGLSWTTCLSTCFWKDLFFLGVIADWEWGVQQGCYQNSVRDCVFYGPQNL